MNQRSRFDSVVHLLGTMPDAAVAKLTGHNPETVRRWRVGAGIEAFRKWRPEFTGLSGVGEWARERDVAFTTVEYAAAAGVTPQTAWARLNIACQRGEVVVVERLGAQTGTLWCAA